MSKPEFIIKQGVFIDRQMHIQAGEVMLRVGSRTLSVAFFYVSDREILLSRRVVFMLSLKATGAMDRAYQGFMATTRGLSS